jgi:hypothetical protein
LAPEVQRIRGVADQTIAAHRNLRVETKEFVMLPVLSPKAMFWTGVGVFVLSEALSVALDHLLISDAAAWIDGTALSIVVGLLLGLTLFGAALTAGACVLRAVQGSATVDS